MLWCGDDVGFGFGVCVMMCEGDCGVMMMGCGDVWMWGVDVLRDVECVGLFV